MTSSNQNLRRKRVGSALSRWALRAAVVGLLTSAPTPAFAQAGRFKEHSAALKEEGDKAMDNLQYEEAVIAYSKALEAYPDPALYYNRGRAHQARSEFPEALADLEKFRDTAPDSLKSRVPALEPLILEVRSRVARLLVVCEVKGAKLHLSELRAERLPMAGPKRLNAGEVRIRVSAEGYRDFERILMLEGGDVLVRVEAPMELLPRTSFVHVRAPENGELFVDGRAQGRVPADLRIRPGRHTLMVRRPGYEEAHATLVLAAEERRVVSLESKPRTVPITSRWWFWTGIGVALVVGAAATAAGMTERGPDRGTGFNPSTVSSPLHW